MAVRRGLGGQALALGLGGARHLQQVVVGAAVLRDLRGGFLARGLRLLAQLLAAGAGLLARTALGRQLRLALRQFLLERLELGRRSRRAGRLGRRPGGLPRLQRGQFVLRLLQLRGGDAQLRAQPLFHALAARGLLRVGHAGRSGQGRQHQGREDFSGHGWLLRNAH